MANRNKLYEKLSWEYLYHRRRYRHLTQFFKLRHSGSPQYFYNFVPPVHDVKYDLTLFDMGFFEPSVMGGHDAPPPHHNLVVITPIIMKFGTAVKLDVFYTMVTKNRDVTAITSL